MTTLPLYEPRLEAEPSPNIISDADAAAWCGLDTPTAGQLAVLDGMVAAAQAMMEEYCGRHLGSIVRTEIIDGTGDRWLYLSEPPESVVAVYQDMSHLFADSTVLDPAINQYMIDGSRLDRYYMVWVFGRKNYKVVYRAGFTVPPGDVLGACRVQVAHMWQEYALAQSGQNVLTHETVAGWTRDFVKRDGLLQEVRDVLDNHRPARL
jgi:hypothetical protein